MQKHTTCFATLQLNEVKSDVARFTTHVFNLLSVFTHVASIYANLLEQKKAFA